LSIYACGPQRRQLLRTSTEDKGISTFEANHGFQAATHVDEQLIDLFLRPTRAAPLFSDRSNVSFGIDEIQNGLDSSEPVIEHSVSTFQQAQPADCQQIRISWAGPD
jgi:hypothetical protein